ncbi:hypothetical protein [Pseudomonas synxantha]|uniref:Uncharacterized protein n=1 Tax=Pseudomonas synxantha TaxID=47883 RepID=A0ACC6JW06_9PSED|nr:hypothetical protein [Pseudomonas synxantha]MDR6610547.1 hypothetical protein [Pseudomonas synxantha]
MILVKIGTYEPLFQCGALVFTTGVDTLVRSGKLDPFHYFTRHIKGDWGDLCEEDHQINADALKDGSRLMSSYQVEPELKLWIITEADRSVTTLLAQLNVSKVRS